MIKRIVFWRVVGQSSQDRQANAHRIKALLDNLSGKIPGLLNLEVYLNEDSSSDAADLVFITEFKDKQSLADYDGHPEHVKIKPEVASLRTERRVVVYENRT
jgi:hypothetical protein